MFTDITPEMSRFLAFPTLLVVLAPVITAQQVARPLAPNSPAPASTAFREFRVDAAHSSIGFTIGFLGHPVRGRFDDLRGTITYAAGKVSASSITFAIGAKSISTGSTHRDEHLRSADFFDVAKYPTILFTSRSSRRNGTGFLVSGPLTMHGVTREISIPFREVTPPVVDSHGSTLVFFAGSVRLARRDFGISGGSRFNEWFDEIRQRTMSDSVDVTVEVGGWDTDYDRSPRWSKAVERLVADGVPTRIATLRKLAAQHPDTLRAAEWELDQAGRALLRYGRLTDAMLFFGLVADLFPGSAAAQASLARGHEASGNQAQAAAAVARALSIDPAETRAMEIRRRIGQ